MKHLGPEQGGGDAETWLRTQLADVPLPDLNLDDEDDVKSADLYCTMEDYDQEEEVHLSSLMGHDLVVGFEEGVVNWRALGLYAGSLVVRQQGSTFADDGYLLVGGSIYIPETRSAMLTLEEQDFLPMVAWDDDGEYEADKTMQGTPYVISGETLCQGAHLFFKPAFLPTELRRKEVVERSLQHPLAGSVISYAKHKGKTNTLFVSDRGFMTPRVRSLHSIIDEDLTKLL